MILFDEIYERAGNDAWLKDLIQLHYNDLGLYLEHKVRWNGWNGKFNEDYCLILDESDLDKSQKLLDEYIDNNSLYIKYSNGEEEGFIIKLKELIKT